MKFISAEETLSIRGEGDTRGRGKVLKQRLEMIKLVINDNKKGF